MRDGSPSGTSFLVSFARALGVDDQPLDVLARELLPTWMARLAGAPVELGGLADVYRGAVRAATFGFVDHMVLRTKAIDVYLVAALRSGIDQLVILGAGLDARAWRISALESATVFEVDHPATQRYKRSRLAGKKPPADIRYVAVDFEREQFTDGLMRMGFRSDAPSVWIWEGVTMYLPPAIVYDSLAQLTSLTVCGSELAMTYQVPGLLPFGAPGRAAIRAMFAVGGEPLKGVFEPWQLASAVAPAWEVVYDADARDWCKLTTSIARPARSFLSERLAIAKRGA